MTEWGLWRQQVEQQLKDLQYRVAELESSIESVDSLQSQQSYDLEGINTPLTRHEGGGKWGKTRVAPGSYEEMPSPGHTRSQHSDARRARDLGTHATAPSEAPRPGTRGRSGIPLISR